MTEHGSRREKAEGDRTAKLTDRERSEQDACTNDSGILQALAGFSAAEPSDLVGRPDLQAAQRTQIALALQQRHGNRYVHRAIAEGDARVAPRTGQAGTIARWPPDNPDDIPRLLGSARAGLAGDALASLHHAYTLLEWAEPPYYSVGEHVQIADNSLWYHWELVDLPDFTHWLLARAREDIVVIQDALTTRSSGSEHVASLLTAAITAVAGVRDGSVGEGSEPAVWVREVVAPLRLVQDSLQRGWGSMEQRRADCGRVLNYLHRVVPEGDDQNTRLEHLIYMVDRVLVGFDMLLTSPENQPAYMAQLIIDAGGTVRQAIDDLDQQITEAGGEPPSAVEGRAGAGVGSEGVAVVSGPIQAPAAEAEAGVGWAEPGAEPQGAGGWTTPTAETGPAPPAAGGEERGEAGPSPAGGEGEWRAPGAEAGEEGWATPSPEEGEVMDFGGEEPVEEEEVMDFSE